MFKTVYVFFLLLRVKFVNCLTRGAHRRSINHLENGGSDYIISSESPYQATTIPLNDISESTPLQVDVDCDLPPLKSMSSPVQLSHKVRNLGYYYFQTLVTLHRQSQVPWISSVKNFRNLLQVVLTVCTTHVLFSCGNQNLFSIF